MNSARDQRIHKLIGHLLEMNNDQLTVAESCVTLIMWSSAAHWSLYSKVWEIERKHKDEMAR